MYEALRKGAYRRRNPRTDQRLRHYFIEQMKELVEEGEKLVAGLSQDRLPADAVLIDTGEAGWLL